MFENNLIDCCAPTLASLKSGSLFYCKCPPDSLVEESVADWQMTAIMRCVSLTR